MLPESFTHNAPVDFQKLLADKHCYTLYNMYMGTSTIFYKKYRDTRDASWKALIQCKVNALPVKVTDICRKMKIKAIPYTNEILQIYDVNWNETDGFCVLVHNRPVIFYNLDKSKGRQRFTIAHELGHIIRGHLDTRSMINREPDPQHDSPEEHEANIFASRLLAPACVLWGCNVTSAQQLASMCDISITSAKFRMKRMEELYEREHRFYAKYGKSCFLQSPLERKVYKQFIKYIEEHKL